MLFLTEDPEIVLRCGTKRLGTGNVCNVDAMAVAAVAAVGAWRFEGSGVKVKVGVGAYGVGVAPGGDNGDAMLAEGRDAGRGRVGRGRGKWFVA